MRMLCKIRAQTKAVLYVALTSALLCGACDIGPLAPPPQHVPPALQFIIDNKTRFAQDSDDPLMDLVPGAVVDDLTALDGCWGVALLADVTFGGKPVVSFYFLQIFDTQTGEFTGWLLQEDAFGLLTLAAGSEGTFSVVGDNRIVEEILRNTGYDPTSLSSDPPVFEWVENAELAEPDVFESLATLSGDRLRLHFGDADREPVDPGDDAVYLRFDCPGASAESGE